MTTRSLRLAKDLSLPLDFATKTAAILAQRRKGKTYTASVIAEEMVAAKQPFVALDPTGAWWGLRAGADGKSDGLPVVVLGGQHGDVPLERTGGRLIADLVVEEPGYYVIDFSLFESGEAERQFAVDFAERLYRAKGQADRDFPLHLFVDEADRFIPQQMRKGSNETSPRLLGAFEAIVRRGGLRGLGTTLISQRAAVVNKNVLEMLDVLITLRTVGPNDQRAILDYIKAHGSEAERDAMMSSLASLDIGEAWIWEPGAEPPLFQRVRIRPRHTFNSSATPKPGEKRIEPKRLADVDLASLQKRMVETIEKAKADDPRELRKQIAELKKQVASGSVPTNEGRKPEGKRVEVLTDADRALLASVGAKVEEVQRLLTVNTRFDVDDLLGQIARQLAQFKQDLWNEQSDSRDAFLKILDAKGFQKILGKLTTNTPTPHATGQSRTTPAASQGRRVAPAAATSRPASLPPSAASGDVRLNRLAERKVLQMLVQHGERTKQQLAIQSGYAASGGGFNGALSKLKGAGFITSNGSTFSVTEAGVAAIGDVEPLPTGPALVAYWMQQFNRLAEREVLRVVVEAYPNAITAEECAARTNPPYEPKGGGFNGALSKLRTLGLVTGRGELRASEELF